MLWFPYMKAVQCKPHLKHKLPVHLHTFIGLVKITIFVTDVAECWQANKHTQKGSFFRIQKSWGGGGDIRYYVPHLPNRGNVPPPPPPSRDSRPWSYMLIMIKPTLKFLRKMKLHNSFAPSQESVNIVFTDNRIKMKWF